MHATGARQSLGGALVSAVISGRQLQQRPLYTKLGRLSSWGLNSPRRSRAVVRPTALQARDHNWGTKTGNKGGESSSSLQSLQSIDTEGPWIALVGQAGEACSAGGTELRVLVYFRSQPGEHLHLVGNHPAFGGWDLSKALELKWTKNHVWQTESAICVQPGTLLEYKYVLFREGEEEPVWQAGKNMVVHIPEDSEGCKFIVEDSWDSSRHNHHVEKPDEHSLPQPIPLTCFECGQCLLPHLHYQTCPKLAAAAANGRSALPELEAAA